MESRLRTFGELVDRIRLITGITNLRNMYHDIRTLMSDCQFDIGYGDSLILKKYTYSVANNTMFKTGNKADSWRIKMPADFVLIDAFGSCCHGMLCPGTYLKQGNYMFLTTQQQEVTLFYYAYMCDGTGTPLISQNQFQAMAYGIAYYLYEPKMWNNSGNGRTWAKLEAKYNQMIAESRGADAWPSTMEEWSRLGEVSRMSTLDAMVHLQDRPEWCDLYTESSEKCADVKVLDVWHWQYDTIATTNANKPTIDVAWLTANATKKTLAQFTNGLTISYSNIGRMGFAIREQDANKLKITDVLGNDITSAVFDKSYDTTLKMEVFISKNYITHSNIYFKFLEI